SPETVENLRQFFGALGYHERDLAIVITASGTGRHFWLRAANVPPGTPSYFRLDPAIGPGELRVNRAPVTAPCSAIDGARYRFEPGTAPEALLTQKPIPWGRLTPLLGKRPLHLARVTEPPIPLPYVPGLDDWAAHLLARLSALPPKAATRRVIVPGEQPEYVIYPSRSEAEMAIICHAITRGWTFAQIRELFEAALPGHYASMKPRARATYLRTSYENALTLVASAAPRVQIAAWYRAAEQVAAAGRGGSVDYLVYRALLQRGWRAATTTPNMSNRDLALAASVRPSTANASLKRLEGKGLITIARRGNAWRATAYRLAGLAAPPAPPPTSAIDNLPGGAELWARDRLGQTAGLVYARLTITPQGAPALAEATGKHRTTVRRALKRLAAEGLAERARGGWIIGTASAATVARDWDAPAQRTARERVIETERELHRERLARRRAQQPHDARKNRRSQLLPGGVS
ncbi:MAG TPA: GntR family transcriptional regulator, partial [Aggregatilineaceae bacterium]|nr:GntR family transcriptional regulator [Aggregatilineaceae bacterium]